MARCGVRVGRLGRQDKAHTVYVWLASFKNHAVRLVAALERLLRPASISAKLLEWWR
jgi:hypothetical protein